MEIVQYPHAALFRKSLEVTEFNNALLNRFLDNMKILMKRHNGKGLAANQVGLLHRMFVMTCNSDNKMREFINPIIELGDGFANLEESCLSAPGIYDTVLTRKNVVTIKYQDRSGAKKKGTFEGIDAVCIQHEYDHLDGIFWFDRMPRNPKRALKRKWEKMKK